MDGLDLLKHHWNRDENFPKIDKEEIRRMLHKNSSSLVKWIFIVSLIELTLGFIITPFIPEVPFNESEAYFLHLVSVVFYGIIFYFIFRFFTLYRRIKVSDSVKLLAENIIRARRVGENYIKFNVFVFSLCFLGGGAYAIYEHSREDEGLASMLVVIVVFLFLTALFITILLFVYKLVYGRKLRRLKKNYEELIRLEDGN